MHRHLPALAVALALQLILVVGVTWWRSAESADEAKPFLVFDRAEVNHITIDEGDDKSLVLEKQVSGWTLPALDGLPADDQKVSETLDKLGANETSWPVATTDAAAKRFEVTEEKFQRRIRLANGDTALADLYLGTSPGFRKVHARRADDSAVYAITFANYEAATKPQDWLSKTLIAPEGGITTVEIPGRWRLTKSGEAWQLDALAEGQTTAEDNAREIVSKLENLRVVDVADKASVAALEGVAPAFELSATTESHQVTYTFHRPTPDGDFLLRASTRSQTFRVSAFSVEGLDVVRDSLIAAPATTGAAEQAAETAPAVK